MKKITVSVISDLVTDQRVHKICSYLHAKGADVTLIGRKLPHSASLQPRMYKTKRISCVFKKGVAQYAEFNLKLFFNLLFVKTDIFLSNDLDTLLPNYLISGWKRKPLVYDSHEYFTGSPELLHKPVKTKTWKWLEKRLLPSIKFAYTVNHSISALYQKETGIQMKVVKNMPLLKENDTSEVRNDFPGKILLIMQGASIDVHRGYEEALLCMKHLPSNFHLLVIGGGNAWKTLIQIREQHQLKEQVTLMDKMPPEMLAVYTRQAALGLTLDKPLGINQLFSLPNKLFDYIHAGVPVLSSDLPEIKKIIEQYNIGTVIKGHDPEHIARMIVQIFDNRERYATWKTNTQLARRELNWSKEIPVLNEIYDQLLQ